VVKGNNRSENLVSEADSAITFQLKSIIEMLCDKLHQTLIAIQEINTNIIPIIIAI